MSIAFLDGAELLEQAQDIIEELEVACCIGRETLAAKDARIAELEAQLRSIVHGEEVPVDDGALYAEGCKP